MNPIGAFTFVLHSHLPYVWMAGRWPHGEEWIHEAAEMLEYSAVSVPCNPEALTLAKQKGLAVPAELEQALEKQQGSSGEDAPPEPEPPKPEISIRKTQIVVPRLTGVKIVGHAKDVEKRVEAWSRGRVVYVEDEK